MRKAEASKGERRELRSSGPPIGLRRSKTGFTLVEMIVVVAIAMVLLAIALPSMAALLRTNRLATAANEMLVMLRFTRSEAIKRRHRVTACVSPAHISCDSAGGWHRGWIVFSDDNSNGEREPGEVVLRAGTARHDGLVITGNLSLATTVSFVASGRVQRIGGALSMGTITLCSDGEARYVVVNRVGRARVEAGLC